MSRSHQEQIRDLLVRASEYGHTLEAVALAEEAVRLADTHNDGKLGYEARMALLDAAAFSGDADKCLVAFSWCLAYADQPQASSGAEIFEWELLWKYKWVVDKLVHFPRITRAQIFSALEDFQSRCRKAGFNDRAAFALRWNVEMQLGDPNVAQQWHDKWQCMDRDGMADCEACEINRVVELHAMRGDHRAAIAAAAPILNGRWRCAEIPHLTYAVLLQGFWGLRGPEATAQIHEKGYRLVRGNRDFIREQARHVHYLLHAGQTDRALTLVRRHLKWALETRSLDYQFHFLRATRAAIRRLGEEHARSVRLRLPEDLCPFAGKTTAPIQPFLNWLNTRINHLAAEFDQRNGNQWFARLANPVATESW